MGAMRAEPELRHLWNQLPELGPGVTCRSHPYLPRGHKSRGWEERPLQNSATTASVGSQSE